MLSAQNISVSFGGEVLFESVSFRLGKGDRVGLIGKNGAGKSTLLKLVAKLNNPSSGEFALEKSCSIGYLPQDLDFNHGRTVLEETYTAFKEIKKIEKRTAEIHKFISETQDFESKEYLNILDELTDLNSNYEILGGYNYQALTQKILLGLGFSLNDLEQLTDKFSGGWRMRIELAKLLLNDHDILLLDEPTNHLDINSIIWLEQFLKKFNGAIVLVSHDRMFLDQITNRTIEIIQKKIFDFKKSYSEYLVFREELRENQISALKNQVKFIQNTEKLIEKFRAKASKASMAQSLIKKLDKIERIEVDPNESKSMKLEFPVNVQPGKIILEAKNIFKHYDKKIVLKNIDLNVSRGDKIAFVGQNGQGKTTLAKVIVDEIKFEGSLKLGHNVQIGYFAQNQSASLDGSKTILQTVEDIANEKNRSRVRDILGSFLFQGDDVEKKVSVLSGGERNRLALCKLLLQPFNVLIMDEPTNHLDILSKNILKQALIKFQGTLILVSHDRDFLKDLCNQIIEFKDNKISLFLGSITNYLEDKKLSSLQELEKNNSETGTKNNKKKISNYGDQKKVRSITNRLSKIERMISQLEKEIKEIDFDLEVNYNETILRPNFFDTYHAKKKELELLFGKWEIEQENLESINKN
jgi:ATP-binding cassette subfamily F protein 3